MKAYEAKELTQRFQQKEADRRAQEKQEKLDQRRREERQYEEQARALATALLDKAEAMIRAAATEGRGRVEVPMDRHSTHHNAAIDILHEQVLMRAANVLVDDGFTVGTHTSFRRTCHYAGPHICHDRDPYLFLDIRWAE